MKRRLVLAGILAATLLATPLIGRKMAPTVHAEEEDISAEDVVPLADIAIDETNFPDENFRKYVYLHFDNNKDHALSDKEREKANNIQISWMSYSDPKYHDLTGIEYLTGLEELWCRDHEIKSLDLSHNTKLKRIVCSRCSLEILNISGCVELERIECHDNKIAVLDTSGCTKLEAINCGQNQISILDLSSTDKLEDLDCRNNNIVNLSLGNCVDVKDLSFSNNQIASVDVSKYTKLEVLLCGSNKLTSLDVSKNTALRWLDCSDNHLTSLDVSKNTELRDLTCSGNQLTSLDVSKCPILDQLYCSENQLASLDVSICTKLRFLYCDHNELTILDVSKNPDLDMLYCNKNQLTKLWVNNITGLWKLDCSENQIDYLDVRQNTYLSYLACFDNRISNLDVSNCKALEDLICYANEIDELNIKENKDLLGILYHGSHSVEKYNGKEYHSYIETLEDEYSEKYLYYLQFDKDTKLWTDKEQPTPMPSPAPNSQSIEIDLSYGEIPYTDNQDLLDAVSVLLQKCESDSLFDCVFDSENQIIHMDLDCDGNIDVDFLLVGYTFLKKADTCSIAQEIVFTEDQLKDTIYKDISFVFGMRYEVTFDANGGTGEMDPQLVFEGNSFVLPECGFVAPKGKEFAGWDLGSVGETIEITKNTVVQAQWINTVYTVKVTTDGNGTAIASVDSGETGTEVTLKAEPNKGYQFKEWKVISGGVTITDNKFVIGTENVEIQATFETIPATPTPTNTPTPKPDDPTPTPIPDKEPSIADFVERLYTIALNRASEPEGKAFWVKEIEDGNRTGGDCAYFFLIEAPEFKNRGLSDEDFVETLYKTFFDRASEAEGKAFWVGQLKNKTMTRDQVIMGFIDSKEWCNVCADYGVKSGAPTAKAEFASKNAINFATRLYTCCLGRSPEDGGLKYWSLALTNLEQTGCSAAKEFFTSTEFVNLKLKDDEYVKRLYKTFMDREPEAGEVSYWTGEIAKGTQTRSSVLAFFGQSEEFTNICKKYGIDRGTI